MKKRKLISLLLVMAMALSLLSISALAATPETVKQYGKYVSLGDSVGSGFGLEDYNEHGEMVHLGDVIEGSYPYLVGQWTGAETSQLNRPGFTSASLRYVLDDSFPESDEYHDWEFEELQNFTFGAYDMDFLDSQKSLFREAIADADLITLDVGLNDTWYTTIALIYYIAEDEYLLNSFDPRTTLENELEKYGSWGTVIRNAMYYFASVVENPVKWAKYVDLWLTNAASYLTNYQKNYSAIVTKIFELNPDVTVVSVGSYNVFKSWEIIPGVNGLYKIQLTDGGPVKIDLPVIGEFVLPDEITLSPTGAMIAQGQYDLTYTSIRKYYEKVYPGQYFYADVSETELINSDIQVPLYEFSTMYEDGYNPHPTPEGHEYMARQIVSVLPERSADDNVEANCPSAKFTDVDTSAWYHQSVDYALNKGIMAGMSDTTFEPNSNVTRAQVATMIYALEGRPAVTSIPSFSDVSDSAWYADPVNWCAANGIVAGMGDGSFQPNADVTREQLATMLRSYASYKGKDVSASGDLSTFADADTVSTWATENVAWAVGNGIISGRTGNLIAPKDTATRAETATMFMQFDKKVLA